MMTIVVHWAQTQDAKTKYQITTQLFWWQNFKQLIERALEANRAEQGTNDWYTQLTNWSPKKGKYMSIGESIKLLTEFHHHNGYTIQSRDQQITLEDESHETTHSKHNSNV